MKYILYTSLLLSSITSAQGSEEETSQNNDQKRPSWSQGLPERQKTMKPSAPTLNLDRAERHSLEAPIVEQIATEKPRFELEKLEAPQFDHQIKIEAPVVEPALTEQPVLRLDTLSKTTNRSSISKTTNPLHKEYKWTVLSTTPINMPIHLNHKKNIDVFIFI